MKAVTPLALSLLLSACASPALNSSPDTNRIPAASDLKIPNLNNGSFPKNYQGPFEVEVEGFKRKPARAVLPLQYESAPSWPLVVLLHGFSGTAEAEDTYLGLRFRASPRGFILLAPEGTPTPPGTRGADGKDIGGNQFWNATDSCCDFAKTGVDDVGYLLALIKSIKQRYKVDSSRIYLIGHSNGGFMVNRLACEAGENFAGIASLAGGTYKDSNSCRNTQAVPYLQIHGTDDKTILYQGAAEYAGGKETVEQWRRKNACEGPPAKEPARDFVYLIPGKDTDLESWGKCGSGKEVAFWTMRSFEQKWHNAHIPLFQAGFTDAVLDFLLKQKRN